jgi:tRNA modification GTPase
LLEEERAIVSDIAGTTRDTIEEAFTIDGFLFRFIDTAGLREAKDEIEKIGVERSKEAIEKAEIIIYVSDYKEMKAEDVFAEVVKLNIHTRNIILVANKAEETFEKEGGGMHYSNTIENLGFSNHLFISAKEKTGINLLKKKLLAMVLNDKIDAQNAVIITNQRHYDALQKSETAIAEVLEKIQQNISSDFISQDIKTALFHLGTITGEIDIDKDILAAIFGKFCIGK